MFDLAAELPHLLPKAIPWVEARSSEILAEGVPLNSNELRAARTVGVAHPEMIRISVVQSLPLPDDPSLRYAALQTGLLGPGMIGVTFGYGIYLVHGNRSMRVVSHECRHVFQYEAAGSIAAFLPVYLEQIASYGYIDAPLEVDARAHEVNVA